MVIVLDVRKRGLDADYDVWTRNGTQNARTSVRQLASAAESLGAGEIVVNSIDNDGLMRGYDLTLARPGGERRPALPMTMLGGAGSLDDALAGLSVTFAAVVEARRSRGASLSSKGPTCKAVLISYPTPTQKEALIHSALAP